MAGHYLNSLKYGLCHFSSTTHIVIWKYIFHYFVSGLKSQRVNLGHSDITEQKHVDYEAVSFPTR